MPIPDSIADRIQQWKKTRRAVIFSHLYQEEEIQEVADVIGDTLQIVHEAEHCGAQVLVVCGARFMAEFVKVVNSSRTILMPDVSAGCSLADSCSAEAVRAFRKRHPHHLVVSYVNTSAAVKAESDILCTSKNAVDVVNSLPLDQPILFLPDINLVSTCINQRILALVASDERLPWSIQRVKRSRCRLQ